MFLFLCSCPIPLVCVCMSKQLPSVRMHEMTSHTKGHWQLVLRAWPCHHTVKVICTDHTSGIFFISVYTCLAAEHCLYTFYVLESKKSTLYYSMACLVSGTCLIVQGGREANINLKLNPGMSIISSTKTSKTTRNLHVDTFYACFR